MFLVKIANIAKQVNEQKVPGLIKHVEDSFSEEQMEKIMEKIKNNNYNDIPIKRGSATYYTMRYIYHIRKGQAAYAEKCKNCISEQMACNISELYQ